MDDRLLKPYSPQETEQRLYKIWEESGYFNPDVCIEKGVTSKDAEVFSIVLPPPNVTGILHMGHAMMLAIEDLMVRFHRMKGRKTLWIPGTDHAAIATQSKVEKDISKKEGKNRHDLGREEFIKRVEQFAKESHDTITKQVKRMGASVDWSREAFTLDEKRSLAVRTAFKKMYDAGLIYRGFRIVNWDPKGQTTISDDEIIYQEEKTKFYYIKYGPFIIGTARPETKFGDKYVVMHPDDKRYEEYKHGQQIEVEWINGKITATIIKDKAIDMEFGTGVMTITPSHSTVDFEISERHSLDKEQIIDLRGKLLPIAGEFAGIKITEARPKIVEKLKEKGLLVKEEEYTHNIATAERTGGFIEPQIMQQWFIDVNKNFTLEHSNIKSIPAGSITSLKELMRKTVESGQISIIPNHFDKTYFHWVDNLKDWCISRQIWYGHRIPVWYRGNEIYSDIEPPAGDGWEQDPDTLDTWFSSGLWTFSTLGWPEQTSDLAIYHPTNVLETGYEILFFWVARMILMTGYHLGTIPFSTVYLHGTIRDAKGRKMSKSLGNGIDPIDIADKYGADAGRMALITSGGPGTDSRLHEDKIKGYKNFANKIWNITRFIMENTQGLDVSKKPDIVDEKNQEIINQTEAVIKDATADIEANRFYMAAEKIYLHIWHQFADINIEDSKKLFSGHADELEKQSRKQALLHAWQMLIKSLHPFMPFVTEEIWSMMPQKKDLLIVEKWPV